MANDNLKSLEEIVKTILEKIDDTAKFNVSFDEDHYQIDIEAENPAILIGFRGENLQSLQFIVSLIFYQQTKLWQPVVVDVGDWRKKREQELVDAALKLAQKAKFSNQAQTISHLIPRERRIIHMALQDHPDVLTESFGDGDDRKLVIKPK